MAEVLAVYRRVKSIKQKIKKASGTVKKALKNSVAFISYDEKPGIRRQRWFLPF